MKKILIAYAIILLTQVAQGQTVDPCEKDGYKTCVYGIKWGTPISDDFMSKTFCPANSGFQPGTLAPCDRQMLCNKLVMRALKGQPLPPPRYTYYGREIMNSCQMQAPGVYHWMQVFLGLNGTNILNEKALSLSLFPVQIGKNTRYLFAVDGFLAGYVTSSGAPAGVDPKIYLFEAQKKYGASTQVRSKIPEDEPYSDVAMWAESKSKFLVGVKYLADPVKISAALNGKPGAVIDSLIPSYPGEKAGLKPGDVVVGVNNEKVSDASSFIGIVSKIQTPVTLKIKLLRQGKEMMLPVPLAKNPGYNENPSPIVRFVAIQPASQDAPDARGLIQTIVVNSPIFNAAWQKLMQEGSEIRAQQKANEKEQKKKDLNDVDL